MSVVTDLTGSVFDRLVVVSRAVSPSDIKRSEVAQRMAEMETALLNFYAAERRAGADPLTANERMHEFAKRLDALQQSAE